VEVSNMKTRVKRVPVTERAIVARINRKLAGDELRLVSLRGRAAEEFGAWVVVPSKAGGPYTSVPTSARIERHGIDLAAYGRELGVLQPWEEVAS
jgi:hypothetical protein